MSNSTPTAGRRGGAGRTSVRHLLWHNGAQLLGLTGIAVAQPLLDLFGRNPTYFVANDLGPASIVVLAVVLTFGLPALLVLAELVAYRVAERAGRLLHLGLIGLLGAVLGAEIARHVVPRSDLASIALAVLVGVGLVAGLRRVPAVALGLRYLALAPVLVLGAFLFTSETSSLLFEGEAEATRGVDVGAPAPVVVLQLDELPLASLIRSDGTINEAQFPGFARLAGSATWYRNATSVSSGTNRSVPSIVSGIVPESEVPTSAEYPHNLFTLLGDVYDLDVHESVTRLCPSSVCAAPPSAASATGDLGDTFADVALVYGHLVLPPALRSSLAPVDRSWSDFFEHGDVEAAASRPSTSEAPVDESRSDPQAQGRELDEWIDGLRARNERSLSYLHVLLPHSPWIMTPGGRPLTNPGPEPGIDETGRWSTDPGIVREGLRLHLLQAEYVDGRLNAMIDRLEQLGVWDDAMVVVVADHGEAFTPGEPGRVAVPGTEPEIFSVPLFVKYPGQTDGAVSDINALTIDVLPTIVDALDIDIDWQFDGRSLLDPAERPDDKPVASNETLHPVYVDLVMAVAARNEAWLPGLGGDGGVVPVEPYADLVGRPVTELDVRGDVANRWQTFEPVEDYDAQAGSIPLLQVGTLLDVTGTPPDAGLVVVNGVVAGVALTFDCDGGRCTFRALLDEAALAPTGNHMDLLLPAPGGAGAFVRATYAPMRGG